MVEPRNQAILYRLPKAELMVLGSMPCPVIGENMDKNDSNKRIIQASKNLRQQFLGYKEEKACAICPLADKCSLKNITAADSY